MAGQVEGAVGKQDVIRATRRSGRLQNPGKPSGYGTPAGLRRISGAGDTKILGSQKGKIVSLLTVL